MSHHTVTETKTGKPSNWTMDLVPNGPDSNSDQNLGLIINSIFVICAAAFPGGLTYMVSSFPAITETIRSQITNAVALLPPELANNSTQLIAILQENPALAVAIAVGASTAFIASILLLKWNAESTSTDSSTA